MAVQFRRIAIAYQPELGGAPVYQVDAEIDGIARGPRIPGR
jgi:hypothetical protein